MRILITGADGQLARDAQKLLAQRHEVHAFGRGDCDVTNDRSVLDTMRSVRPDVVLHAAAYTKVDDAEREEETAFAVNAIGTRNVAIAAEQVGAKLVHISTDYVFDGSKGTPYHEFDPVAPINNYGRSKAAAEEMALRYCPRTFVLRTSWVFGKQGTNFVKTMLELAKTRTTLSVVNDQFGSPTYTVDLVHFTEQVMATERYGIYHATNTGTCSWYEFAKEIFAEFDVTGLQVLPVSTEEFPRPARRPHDSRLDHMAIRLNRMRDLPHWRDALARFREEMNSGGELT